MAQDTYHLNTFAGRIRCLACARDRNLIGPQEILIDITGVCNLRCLHCMFHAPTSDNTPEINELPFASIRGLLDDARLLRVENIAFCGDGEPTLHSRFGDIAAYALSKRFRTALITNATFPEEHLALVRRFDWLCFDLSACDAQQYRRLQSLGKKDYFAIVKRNISFLASLKKNRKKAPYLRLIFILHAGNYKSLPEIYELADTWGVDELTVKNLYAEDHNSHLKLTSDMLTRVNRICAGLLSRPSFRKVNSNIKTNHHDHGVFLNDFNLVPRRPGACYIGWFHSFVRVNGDVAFCCQIDGEPALIGNIHKTPFKKIWFAPRYQRLRLQGKHSLFGGRQDATCGNCCYYKKMSVLESHIKTAGERA